MPSQEDSDKEQKEDESIESEQNEKTKQIESMNSLLLKQENKITSLKQQNQEYKDANYRQQTRILFLEQENNGLQNERDSIEMKYKASAQEISELKVYQNQNDSLKVNFFMYV